MEKKDIIIATALLLALPLLAIAIKHEGKGVEAELGVA